MLNFKVNFKSVIQVQMIIVKDISRHEWVNDEIIQQNYRKFSEI